MTRTSYSAILGLALFLAFFGYSIFPTIGMDTGGMHDDVVFRSIAHAAFGIAILVFLAVRGETESSSFSGMRIAALACGIAIILASLFDAVSGIPLSEMLVNLLSAFHIAALSFAWMLSMGAFNGREHTRIALGSMLLAAGIVYMIDASCSLFQLPRESILQVIPLMSTLFLFFIQPTSVTENSIVQPSGKIGSDHLVRMLVVLMVYDFGSGLFRNAYIQTDFRFESFQETLIGATIAVAMAAMASYYILKTGFSDEPPTSFWIAIVVLCMITLYCAAVITPSLLPLCNGAILSMRFFVVTLVWMVLGILSRRFKGSSVYLVGGVFLPFVAVSRIIVYGPWDIISIASRNGFGESVVLILMIIAVFALTVAMFWYLQSLGFRSRQEDGCLGQEDGDPRADVQGGMGSPDIVRDRDAVCLLLQDRFGLTEREREVLVLLSEGNSQKKTAEILCLSVSSVQAYSKTLYRKLGIHSKQEAIDLVGKELSSER